MKTGKEKPKLIYWKEEAKNRPWKQIPDTPKARKIAIKQGAMFITWASLSEPYKSNGQPEPIRYGDLPLDFDHKEDPGQALEDVQTLLGHLVELYGIDPYSIRYFLSGGKGFHVVIPAEIFSAHNGDPHLPLIYKMIVSRLKEQLGLKTLDLSMYCMGKGKMFRIPNVKRSNGWHKVPISFDEVQGKSIKDLMALSEQPRTIDPVEFDLCPIPDLEALFKTYQNEITKEKSQERSMPTTKPKALPKEIPPCIAYILSESPNTANTTFNKIVMNLINFFQGAGYDYDTAIGPIYPFLENYPYSSEYTTPEKRVMHFDEQWEYLAKKGDYDFKCSYIKGLGFTGSAFDCKTCELNTRRIPEEVPAKTAASDAAEDRVGVGSIKDYIDSIDGKFTTRDLYYDLGITDPKVKEYARVALNRLRKAGIIERWRNEAGAWRKVQAEVEKMDLENTDYEILDLWMPLDIHEFVNFMPGNTITIAGDANAGKTAFMLNIAKNNIRNFQIHYFSSEMGPQEMKMRIDLFDDFPITHENFNAYERSDNFTDVIRPGKGHLNIIDYLEVVEDFYLVGKYLKDIHDKLKGALAIVAIQKRHPGQEDALGGKRWLEKARLALSISAGRVRIIKAKNWRTNQNPNRLSAHFKLIQSTKFIRYSDWKPEENTK